MFFSTTGTITLTGGTLALANNGSTPSRQVDPGPGRRHALDQRQQRTGVFSVRRGVTASITGLTITGGLAAGSGGAIDNSGTLTLSNLAVTGNAASFGGGVANEADGHT